MCDGYPVRADVVFVAKLQEFPTCKLGAVVGDDGVQHSHYEVNLEAVASGYVVPEGIEDEAAMEQADALAADAAEALTEAFSEFLFPDAADGDEPQA
jgi:hypothetical protein